MFLSPSPPPQEHLKGTGAVESLSGAELAAGPSFTNKEAQGSGGWVWEEGPGLGEGHSRVDCI